MKRFVLSAFLFIFLPFLHGKENDFFISLSKKELATFNDGITIIKMLFNEKELNTSFYENILWAAEKKLFRVTIPITTDQINPIITRRELAYWICRIYNGKDGLVNNKNITRYTAFNTCVILGIIDEGRGGFDSLTGLELLDTFSYLDYYIKYHKILPDKEILDVAKDDEYQYLPEWRRRIYKELEEQRAMEKELRMKRIEASKKKTKTENKTDKIDEKKIE
jgi:hypothetical protein